MGQFIVELGLCLGLGEFFWVKVMFIYRAMVGVRAQLVLRSILSMSVVRVIVRVIFRVRSKDKAHGKSMVFIDAMVLFMGSYRVGLV